MHEELAITYNGIFESHEEIAELKEGYLFTMNKSGKARVVENARPIALSSITRRVLSSVVLRVSDKAGKLLSLSQQAYMAHRSATAVKSRKRAAEKATRERRKKEEARKRQRGKKVEFVDFSLIVPASTRFTNYYDES